MDILRLMQSCFDVGEISTEIRLCQGRIHEVDNRDNIAEVVPYYYPGAALPEYCELTLCVTDDLTIVHELVHVARWCRYGYAEHNDDDIDNEAMVRLKNVRHIA